MCYKNPGPRCDQEVLLLLIATKRKQRDRKSLYVEEHCELLMTRGGLTALSSMIEETEDPAEREELLKSYKTGHANFVRKMRLIGKTPRKIKDHPDVSDVPFEKDVEQLARVSSRIYTTGGLAEKMSTLETRLNKTGKGDAYYGNKVVEYAHANQASLKDATVGQMQEELQGITRDLPVEDAARVLEAASLAEYLHRNDVRKTPQRDSAGIAREDTDPYIIHPLRNTLRISRWGCRDADVLAASMLHDTVEDNAKDFAVEYAGSDPNADEEEHREASYKYLQKKFGPNVSNYVRGMSTPIMDKATRYDKEKSDAAYAQHVKEAVTQYPQVLVLKVSDFIDNALSAHAGTIDKRTVARTKKYAPLVPIFTGAVGTHRGTLNSLITHEGTQTIERRMTHAETYLADIISLEK